MLLIQTVGVFLGGPAIFPVAWFLWKKDKT